MPPKKAPSIGLSKPRQKSSSNLSKNRTTASTSKVPPLETHHSEPAEIPIRKRTHPDTSIRASEPVVQIANTSKRQQSRQLEPAFDNNTKRSKEIIPHSSKHSDPGRLYVDVHESVTARLSKSNRQQGELDDAPTEGSGTLLLRTNKSTMIDRRKSRSLRFGNAPSAENSRRQSKRLSLDVGRQPREQKSDASSDLSDMRESSTKALIGHQWKMFRVSPLYGFSRAPQELKKYSSELCSYLTAARAALLNAADVRYKTAFTVLPGLRWDDDRPEALQVEVLSLVDGSKPRTLYRGILLSWGKNVPSSTADKCSLPLLLCKGVARTMFNVHSVLSRIFDTVIQPMELSEADFKWVSAISMQMANKPPDVPLAMHFKNGPEDKLTVSASALRAHRAWCEIHDGEGHLVSLEEVELLHEVLHRLVDAAHCVELNKLVLTRIDFPNVVLLKDGQMKMRNVESVDLILRYFCCEALLQGEHEGMQSSNTNLV